MLAYDSSDDPQGNMTQILQDVNFSTDEIEEIRQEDIKRHETEMSKMLRKRFPKSSSDKRDNPLKESEKSDEAETDPDELLKEAIANKLDDLEKKDPYNKE